MSVVGLEGSRKGQVTIFVILGIVLVIVVGLFLMVRGFQPKNTVVDEGINSDAVNYFVQSCAFQSLDDSLKDLLELGFIVNDLSPKYIQDISGEEIIFNYYQEGNDFFFPSIDEVKIQEQLLFKDRFLKCINDFSDFSNNDFEIIYLVPLNPETQIVFNEDNTVIFLNMSIMLKTQKETKELNSFYADSNYKISKHYSQIEKLVNKQKSNPELFQIGYIAERAYLEKYSYELEYVTSNNLNLVTILLDDESYDSPLIVRFALK